jgi:DNA-binding NtrC family response regulator
MPILTAEEIAFAEAVGTLTYCNPFLPERIAAEKAAAGADFVPHGDVWSVKAGDDREAPNIRTIAARAEETTVAIRDRFRAPGAKPSMKELGLYRDLVVYVLYYRFVEELLALAERGVDPSTERLDCPAVYRRFERDCRSLLDIPGVHLPDEDIAHYFACQYQVRRAFNVTFHRIVGGSMATARLRAAVWQSVFTHDMRRYRRLLYDRMGDLPVLITGPSGTGKELVAKGIAMSRYIPFDPKTGCFASVPVQDFHGINLSAITPTLIESALFGHRRGAFTGALEDREGWLQVCGPHGTVFLDEIGEITPEIQVKLLRVLEIRAFQRIGDTEERCFAGKLTAATNRDLGKEIDAGRFRADLYYRLCGDIIRTPSLREQMEDNPAELRNLALFVAGKLVPEKEAEVLTGDVLAWIDEHLGADYAWPGNVRELEQCVRNILVRGEYHPLERASRPVGAMAGFLAEVRAGRLTLERLSDLYITLVYRQDPNYVHAADALGIDRRTVKARIDEEFLRGLDEEA